jgi:hypothetical protein
MLQGYRALTEVNEEQYAKTYGSVDILETSQLDIGDKSESKLQ